MCTLDISHFNIFWIVHVKTKEKCFGVNPLKYPSYILPIFLVDFDK